MKKRELFYIGVLGLSLIFNYIAINKTKDIDYLKSLAAQNQIQITNLQNQIGGLNSKIAQQIAANDWVQAQSFKLNKNECQPDRMVVIGEWTLKEIRWIRKYHFSLERLIP